MTEIAASDELRKINRVAKMPLIAVLPNRLRLFHWGWAVLATGVLFVPYVVLSIWLPHYREQRVLDLIETAGGTVHEAEGGPEWLRKVVGDSSMRVFNRVSFVYFDRPNVTDAELIQLSVFTNLDGLNLYRARVTDAQLVHLKPLSKLTYLGLESTEVGDAGLDHLRCFERLTNLHLGGTHVTDIGLAVLSEFSRLERLELANTRVTDAGLAHLAGLSNLEWLELDDRNISEVSVAVLKGLPKLWLLSLRGTTDDPLAVRELQAALPNCKIVYKKWSHAANAP